MFDVRSTTRVWKGRGLGTHEDITTGQVVALNLTDCTLRGPGRVTNIGLDEESRSLATAQQLEVHRHDVRLRGLPGRIVAVDDKQKLVTVTLFDGCDPKLFDDFDKLPIDTPLGTINVPTAPIVKVVVIADDSLRKFDQVNIVKSGPILKKSVAPAPLGSSGLTLTFQPNEMLEGFRKHRLIRLFPATWPIIPLPREEELQR